MSDFDKLHPQAIDLEEAILGACLLDKNAYLVVADLLAPETFYKEAHSIIWEAIQLSFNEGKPIDIISITHAIRKMGLLEAVGGAYAITALTNSIREVENIQHHAMSIKQLWMLRELIVAGGNLIKNAYLSGADPFDLISYISASIDEISLSIEKTKEMSVKQQLKNTIREIEASAKNDYTIGQSTGIKAIDKLGRLIRGDLIVLGARPGMGKTGLAIQIGNNVSFLSKEPVLIFSLEMTHQQLWKREISRQTSILHDYVRSGRLTIDEWKSINNVVGKIGDSKIEVYDFPRQPISYMRRKMMQAKNKHGTIGLVVIDYLQLAETDSIKKNGTREQEISQISRGIKVLAKEFDTPVIAIASLSRASEKRTGGSVPIMSDLREGGSIESDADKVWLLYRPEYYGIMEDEEGQSTKGIAMIYQPKNRSGDVGKIKLRFNGATVAFDDIPDDTVYTDEFKSPPF